MTATKRQGAAGLCLCPQLTLVQSAARGIREEALHSKRIVAFLFHCCDIKPAKKKRGGEKVQFTQNAPSAHKRDTPVLPAHPLLFKSFFNFTARWDNKNSWAALSGPSSAYFSLSLLLLSGSSAPSPHNTSSVRRTQGAGWQARTISRTPSKMF